MKYVGVKTTGELRLHEVKEPQTDEIYMAVEDDKLGAAPIRPYEFVKWDGKQWVKVPGVQLMTTLDGISLEERMAAIELQLWKETEIEADTLRFVFEKTGFDPNTLNISNIKWTKKDSAILNVWEAKYLNNAGPLLSGKFRYTGHPSINNFNQTGWVDVVAGNVNKGFFMGLATNESLKSVEIREGSFGNSLYSSFSGCSHLKSLILPTSGIEATTISRIADNCYELEYVNNFDTSEVTDASGAFNNCNKLKNVPLLDTGKMTNVSYMFLNCYKVEEGSYNLYAQMASQTTPPSNHGDTFYNCGKDTTTGADELARIPASWGGTAAG